MDHEFSFIDWIRRRSAPSEHVPVSIGDDCAVVRTASPSGEMLVAKDVLLEGTHFDLQTTPADQVGRKALAVNLSDIAAMAGIPRSVLVGLALSRRHGVSSAEQLMMGLETLADEFGVCLAGGDTNIWDGPLVLSVTIVGDVVAPGAVLRSGARPGDWVFVTGELGGSLPSGRHLTFSPRVREALALHAAVTLHAMIDLSDGLSSDLQHVLRESGGLGAVLDAQAVPIHPDVPESLSPAERLQHALNDGEDFELLFTVAPEEGGRLLASPPVDCRLTKIGEITPSGGALLKSVNGATIPLPAAGYEHRF